MSAFDEDLFRNARPGRREAFDPARFVTWLEVLMEAGEDVAARRFAELSEDFVTHALNSLVVVLSSDALRDRMDEGGRDAERVDKRLESALMEEIDGYLLIARNPDGWDAVFALILALDRDHRALLERVLDRCASISSELIDDLSLLSTVLSEGASLAEDVEAEREDRRGRAGFVEPRAARSFLELARTGTGAETHRRDPIARAYFRELEPKGRAPAVTAPPPDAARLLSLLDHATEEGPKPRRALPGPRSPIVEALQALRELDASLFEERMEELAFLANVLVAGATVEGHRFRPPEATEAALATVAFGAELEARAQRHGKRRPSTPAELCEALKAHPADLLFRSASAALARRGPASAGFLRDRGEIDAALHRL